MDDKTAIENLKRWENVNTRVTYAHAAQAIVVARGVRKWLKGIDAQYTEDVGNAYVGPEELAALRKILESK